MHALRAVGFWDCRAHASSSPPFVHFEELAMAGRQDGWMDADLMI